MDFIRKNWSRLSLAFLFFIGGVIAVVARINSGRIADGNWVDAFYNTALLISTLVFFFGMVAVTVIKSMENSKKIVSIVYMTMGSIISLLLVVLIVVASSNSNDVVLFVGDGAVESLYQLWVPFLVFGLYPLIKGITRFIEAETVPAKAPVAQPTAPAAAAVEEAPKKAPAKKAAK